MPKSKSTDNIITESEQIERMWAQNQTFSLGELTLEQLRAKLADPRAKNEPLNGLSPLMRGVRQPHKPIVCSYGDK